jgi:hypothetical protein
LHQHSYKKPDWRRDLHTNAARRSERCRLIW